MNKRGSWVDYQLGKLIEAVLIIGYCVVLLIVVKTSYESSIMERRMIAADTATLIDTLHASPGNAIIHYYNNWQGFKVGIEENRITISPAHGQVLAQEDAKFRFASSKDFPVVYARYFEKGKQDKEFLFFQKTDFGVSSGTNKDIDLSALDKGENVDYQRRIVKSVLIDTLNDKVGKRAEAAEKLTLYFSSVDATSSFDYIYYARDRQNREIGLGNRPDVYIIIESIAQGNGCFVFYQDDANKGFAFGIANKISSIMHCKAAYDPNDGMLKTSSRSARIVIMHTNPKSADIGKAIFEGVKNG